MKIRIRIILKYFKGEYFCRIFHKPLIYSFGGFGFRNLFGKYVGKPYSIYMCANCGIFWESSRKPKPLTEEQKKIVKEAVIESMGN